MTLKEFVEKTKEEYNLKTEVSKIISYVTDLAKKEAKNGCACIDDETVHDWIINVDSVDLSKIAPIPAKVATVEKPKPEPKVEEPKKEILKVTKKEKKHEEKQYEEFSLFDL